MDHIFTTFINATVGYWGWFWSQVSLQSGGGLWGNYFYFLVVVSLVFFGLEVVRPWRIDQPKFRLGFWLDAFYMFFNFFLFSMIGFAGLAEVGVDLFNEMLAFFGVNNLVSLKVGSWPKWAQLILLFVAKDFVEWWVHRLLHYSDRLWEFHKVHHSVKQMGFAAHLRYHWMENVLYKSIEYIPLAMIGFSLDDFFLAHMVAIAIGHWNHANFKLEIGPLKYIINNPSMHIWHHAHDLPAEKRYGVNFGISLSIWDYLFGTDYIPKDGRDITLGFPNDDNFPKTFGSQVTHGFGKIKSS